MESKSVQRRLSHQLRPESLKEQIAEIICSKCRNSLGTGSKKCPSCVHYPELLRLKYLQEHKNTNKRD